MNIKQLLGRVDSYQQRRRWLAVPVAVIKKFGDDQGGNQAALIAYYAFFSLFPLLLVFVTILGFVLHGDPSAEHSLKSSVLAHFPIIGTQIGKAKLQGNGLALVIGIATSLLAGMGIVAAASSAFDRVWAVPMKERPGFLGAKLRGLIVLAVLGGLFIITSVATGLLAGNVGPLAKVGGIVLALLLNFALFMASFRLIGTLDVGWRALLPGVCVAAVLWEIVQVVATVYIKHIENSNSAYGIFAVVLGVLAWLHLGAQMTVICAEINVVLDRGLWPRSLSGPPDTAADEQTLTALAKVEERHEVEQVDVVFGQSEPSDSAPDGDGHSDGDGADGPHGRVHPPPVTPDVAPPPAPVAPAE